ncbi:MAG: hypothetical protein CO093_00670 [Alphaproteobacteria bacterium CG_4_9_14_3_um_filter_47_13]|nr:MAG: hypothetical protein CO093_00670 [Alphaproteobacteria bacterium CG_4_9_14_3_um_filter_47_13]
MNQKKKKIFWIGALFILLHSACLSSAPAQAESDPRPDFISVLNDENIRSFLKETSDVSTGQRASMSDQDVIDYFDNHIAEKGEFKSRMHYEIPGYPAQDNEIRLDKTHYIDTVVKGRHMLEDYRASIDIQNLKIKGNGKGATFTSIITEKGKMAVPKDPEKPEEIEMVPIEGKSVCEQRLVISFNNYIQMASADCTTTINFDPFAGKPLVPE